MNVIFRIGKQNNSPVICDFAEAVASHVDFLLDFENKISKLSSRYDLNLQKEINEQTLNIVKQGHKLEEDLNNKKLIKEIKDAFRNEILPWMGKSKIMDRALKKPRGYPGDYQMLEYIYNNKPVSEGIGYYFDEGFLKSELTEAVRQRKDMMREILKKETQNNRSIRILDLACGSSREIVELNKQKASKSHYFCLDFDEEALDYSKKALDLKGVQVNYIKEDILEIIKKNKNDIFKEKDLIYSVGLVDYFPDRLFKNLIKMVVEAMAKGSKLIITIKDKDVYSPIREDWMTDWSFLPRNQKSVPQLIESLEIPDLEIKSEKVSDGIIIFYWIYKK